MATLVGSAEGRKRTNLGLRRAGSLVVVLVAGAVSLSACGESASPGVASVGPTTTTSPPSTAQRAGADALRYSQCMRAHGVSDFPDPTAGGGFHVPAGVKRKPQFVSASEACQDDLSGGLSAKHVTVREELKYAECMRAHGIRNFPDPMPGGGFRITNTTVNTHSPQFEAATRACAAKPGSPGVHPNGP